jgi:hypothetical protein
MSDWPWVVACYGLTWLVLGSYAVMIHRRGARARTELETAMERTDSSMEMQ